MRWNWTTGIWLELRSKKSIETNKTPERVFYFPIKKFRYEKPIVDVLTVENGVEKLTFNAPNGLMIVSYANDKGEIVKVELLAVTPNAVDIGEICAKTCVAREIPDKGCLTHNGLKRALESGHESIIEHIVLTFAVSGISRACSHQLVRHRIASYSQQSQRYVKVDGSDFIVPESVKGGGFNDWIESYKRTLNTLADELRKNGVPEEDIRYFYPQGAKTNIVVTMNARELKHFFNLRCCSRAQWEIRELADKMLGLAKQAVPIVFDNAGASCVTLGYCPEGKRSCGRCKNER